LRHPDGTPEAADLQRAALLHPDLYAQHAYVVSVDLEKDMERRLALEQDRLVRHESREQIAKDLALGTLGSLTAAASVAGLVASVAAVPAVAPAFIVFATYLISKLRRQASDRASRPAPPVFSSLGESLAREREIIRCFSPKAAAAASPKD
jgi:hypothetical protein